MVDSIDAVVLRPVYLLIACGPPPFAVFRVHDKFARLVATCYQGEDDVARFMVWRGLALDWPRYSGGAYADAESEARSAERGLWQGAYAPPWNWRHGRAALTSRP